MSNTNEQNTYGTKSNAARALRKIGKGLEDLLEQLEDGRWTFDVADAKALAALDSDSTPGLEEEVTTAEKKEATVSTEQKTEYTLEDAQREAAELDAADEAAGKPVAKKGQSEEQKAARAEANRLKAEAKKAENAAKAEARKAERAAKNSEKDAAKEKAKQERLDRAAAKAAEKSAGREAREAKAAARAEAAQARADKKAKAEQDRKDAELARSEAREAARLARASTIKNGIRLPGQNSKLGKLWALIEGLRDATGEFPSFQSYKSATEGMDYADKGGPATVTTAYYDYRMYHGVTGRIVEPKTDAEAVEADEGQQGEGAQAE